ncbi:MAG: hypothetical protein J6Y98_04890 [Bacteroidales bacterium]|nr:hypothetical protein [Bacteroidales bacterium]
MLRRLCILFFSLFLINPLCRAQYNIEDFMLEAIETWMEQNDDETDPDELIEWFLESKETPLNINDTLSERYRSLPFLSDFQRSAINAYIAQNGELVTLAELHFINGLDSLTIMLLNVVSTVSPSDKDKTLSWKDIVTHGHSNLRTGMRFSFPESRGYEEDIYRGSPLRLYFRYNYKYHERFSFLLSGDKDPGEALRFALSKSGDNVSDYGFDFYGFHIMVRDIGMVKSAIIGQYNLQFGQGLTLWTGYAPWGVGSMPLRRYGQGIRPASAFCEYGYLQGVATTLSLIPNKLDMTLFFSDVNRDATSTDSIGNTFSSFYLSGYHRTANELSKKHALGERLVGTHIQYTPSNMTFGVTAVYTSLDSEIMPTERLYNHFAFRGKTNLNIGADFSLLTRRVLWFGEVAGSYNNTLDNYEIQSIPVSALAGFQFNVNSDNMFSLVAHYNSPLYHNLHSNTIGGGGTTQGGSGLLFFFRTVFQSGFLLQSSVDLSTFPWFRYRVYSPSTSVVYRCRVTKDISRHTTFSFYMHSSYSQRNSDAEMYYTENTARRQVNIMLNYNASSQWRFMSRVVFSHFSCEDHASLSGFLMSQDAQYQSRLKGNPFSITARLSVFDIDAYDARIFIYENDLVYEYSSPMVTGRGIRSFLLCRMDLGSSFSIGLKYAVVFLPGNDEIGSGYDRISGNHRHDIKAQLCWRF